MAVEPTTIPVREGMFAPRVYRAGRGQPLLWLHGELGMQHFPAELEQLARSYDVIAPVHPGWDDTPGLAHVDDVHAMVVYYQDFADALGLTSFALAGHSLGGLFAAELAAARPDLVTRLVLVAPMGLWLDEAPVADIFTLLPEEFAASLFADPANPAVADLTRAPANEDEAADMIYSRLANLSATGKFIWPIPDKGLSKRLHRIKAPALLVWGDRDRLVPPAYGEAFRSRLARAELATIAGAGHMVQAEKPAEFASAVTSFLG
jgi:pimeloyl-ACP methyl ester carboxylesterase